MGRTYRNALGPDKDGRLAPLVAGVHSAGGQLVNVVLHDGGGDHGGGGKEVADGHAADGRQVDADLAEAGVDDVVEDRDHNDNGDGVEVLDDVIGGAGELHGSGLSGEVTGHLVVRL